MRSTSSRRRASPTDIDTPSDTAELDVCGLDLSRARVHNEGVDTLDRINVSGQALDIPPPRDLVAAVEDLEGLHGWDGGGTGDAVDEVLL